MPFLLLMSPSMSASAERWAQQLGLALRYVEDRKSTLSELAEHYSAVLLVDEEGLALQALEKPLPGPVRVDFVQGTLRWRQEHGGGLGEMVAKACGVKKDFYPVVLDGTAGLGRDAFILASLGCQVQMFERSPVVAALLQDGLERAHRGEEKDTERDAGRKSELAAVMARMTLNRGSVLEHLQAMSENEECRPDVVYLDPMFPHREKTALVKKEMRVFRSVVGEDLDADALLPPALSVAKRRVVVKRPRHAPWLANTKPSMVIEGKSGRFDIYLSTNK